MAGALTKQLNESFKYTSSFNWLLSPYLITNKKYIFYLGTVIGILITQLYFYF